MKKQLLYLATMLAFGTVSAQNVAKTPMNEHFTSASCGPCVQQNIGIRAVLDAYSGNFVKVNHQGNFSFDPMENQFPAGPEVRGQYYNLQGVPTSVLNGNDGYPSDIITAATLAAVAAQTTPYEVVVTQNFTSPTSIDLVVEVINHSSAPISTANKIFISMIENEVTFTTAPGSNGEKVFEYVLRQMYDANTGAANATAGSALGTIPANSTETFNLTITPPSYIADLKEVAFAAYIQLASSDHIEQAGKSQPSTNIPGLLDLSTSTNSTVGSGYCNYSFDPVINFTNNTVGTDVTTFVVQYDINGGTPVQETFNGTLTNGQSTTVSFPNINLPAGTSVINYEVVSVNGAYAYSGGAVQMASETFNKLNTTASTNPLAEGFQGPTLVAAPTGVIADNPNNIEAQTISSANLSSISHNLGGHGNTDGCFFWDFYTTQSGSSKLVFEKLDFTGKTANQLTFTHAYAQYSSTSDDRLKVKVSTDCGATWTTVFNKAGAALATAPLHGNNIRFWPEITEWEDNTVDLSAYDNESEVIIAFEGTSDYGNSLFIDDVNTSQSLGVNEINQNIANLSIMPNPVANRMNVSFSTESAVSNITISNLQGQIVKTISENTVKGENNIEINTTELVSGVYFFTIASATNVSTQRFIVNK